jgi:hypothetical protein
VDDFCHAATQLTDDAHLPTIRRASIQGIHALFPPTSITGHVDGKEPIFQKNLAQGDGNFESTKDMIGFQFDGIKRTVRLPMEKAKDYVKEIHTVLRWKAAPLKTLQMLVGKLCHASVILLAAKGFFTPLNRAMRGNPKTFGLGSLSEVRAALKDLISLMKMLSTRPTSMNSWLTCLTMLATTMPPQKGPEESGSRLRMECLPQYGKKRFHMTTQPTSFQTITPWEASQTQTSSLLRKYWLLE